MAIIWKWKEHRTNCHLQQLLARFPTSEKVSQRSNSSAKGCSWKNWYSRYGRRTPPPWFLSKARVSVLLQNIYRGLKITGRTLCDQTWQKSNFLAKMQYVKSGGELAMPLTLKTPDPQWGLEVEASSCPQQRRDSPTPSKHRSMEPRAENLLESVCCYPPGKWGTNVDISEIQRPQTYCNTLGIYSQNMTCWPLYFHNYDVLSCVVLTNKKSWPVEYLFAPQCLKKDSKLLTLQSFNAESKQFRGSEESDLIFNYRGSEESRPLF